MVEMADGTFKTALDLQVGDVIKTVDIPNADAATQTSQSEYIYSGLTYETLSSNTTYSTNEITNKKKVNRLAIVVTLTFEDGSTWEDTVGSSYLVDVDGVIQFKLLSKVKQGDVVLLVNKNNDVVEFVRKTIVSAVESKAVFSGWLISVAVTKLFLTKTTSTGNESYVSIEHNYFYCPSFACICPGSCPSCPKSFPFCGYTSTCSNGQQLCN